MSNNLEAIQRAKRRWELRLKLEDAVKGFLEVKGGPKEAKAFARLAKAYAAILLMKAKETKT